MNINTGMVQMLNVTGKGDMSGEKTGQSDSLISFRNILAEKLNEKGTTSFKGEVSEKTLADNENDVKELLSDPFFYFAAQFGFLDNLKNFIKNDGNTTEASPGEETVSKVALSDNSMSFNNNVADIPGELQGSANKELTEIMTALQNNDSTNKNVTDILKDLQTDGSMNKEVLRMFAELQNKGSINKEITDMLAELQTNSSENMDIAPPPAGISHKSSTNKEMTDILTALQASSPVNKELAGVISKFGNDNSVSPVEENIPLPEAQNPSGPVHMFAETILKDNIMSSKDFKDLLGKVSQSLKDLINSAGTSETLPDTVSSIKELLSELLESGDTLKDIIKKSDYRDLEGIIAKSPFLAKIQDLLNLFDRNTDTPDKKKDVSDIVSEANSIVSSLEQAVKKYSEKDTEYKVTDTSGKEEKDLFLLQQKTLENITYTRLHPEHIKNMSETKREIMSVDLSSQIVKKIDWKSTDKNSMATITLEPESLGKMRVEVNLAVTGEVSARFITQNKQAGEILSEQLNQLKQSLSEQGLKLGNFSVSTEDRSSPGFQQYMPDFNEKKYVASIKNDKEDYSIQLNNKITTSQMDYFV